MWADLVVDPPPFFHPDRRIRNAVKFIPVQTAAPQGAVEALARAILPWLAGIDVRRLDMVVREPLPELMGDELSAAVAAQVGRIALPLDQALQHPLYVFGAVLECRHDGECIGRGFVLDRQTADHTPRGIAVMHKVIAPDRVPHQRLGIESGTGENLALRDP